MRLHFRIWIVFSLLFVIMASILYILIIDLYEERTLEGKESLTLNQGASIVERLRGTYPKFPERTMAYLNTYGERLNIRLLIIDSQGQIRHDSFEQLQGYVELNLPILEKEGPLPRTKYTETHNYGYVQHTLLPLYDSYLLMVEDINTLYEDIRSFQKSILLLIAIAMIIFFIISYFIASWFSTPISTMIFEMKKITRHHRSFTFQYKRNDEIKELVEAIKTMVHQLNEYEKRQRQFLSASSHELKTPLTTMQLISENLPYVREDAPRHQEFVNDLALQINHMKEMVNHLLNINRSWDQPLTIEAITTTEMKEHIERHFQHIANDRNISLDYQLDELKLHGDRQLFFQAIDNMITNAIRYSSANTSITITVQKADQHTITLSICDQGIGINKDDIPYLFDPFYRATEAIDWNEDGTGLGLTLVKQMVDRHEGKVEVQSTPGEGTCFHIYLSAKKSSKMKVLNE